MATKLGWFSKRAGESEWHLQCKYPNIVKLEKIQTIPRALQSSSDVSGKLWINLPVQENKEKADMFKDGVPVVIAHHAKHLVTRVLDVVFFFPFFFFRVDVVEAHVGMQKCRCVRLKLEF